jgi:glycine cleavage system H protein
MDGFSYHNIFATKGIEYIVIISFLLLLIPFWLLLNRKVKNASLSRTLGILTSRALKVPQGILFSANHTWAFLERSGAAKVGLDDLLLHLTGEVDFRNLKKPGDAILKGELMTEIHKNGLTLKVFSPISGRIVSTNQSLNAEPEMLVNDPYGIGWVYKIKPSNWLSETSDCYLAEDASEWSNRELQRFRDFVSESVKKQSPGPAFAILQDGGELRDNALSELPEPVWKDFQESFLKMPPEK